MHQLRNHLSKDECLKKLKTETFERKTLSFYRYVIIKHPKKMRDTLYKEWYALGVLGRTYVAKEGINAQVSVPEPKWDEFAKTLYARPEFKDVPFKVGVEQNESFWKLIVRNKKQIVADGLTEDEYDVTNVGKHLTGEEFNEAMDMEDSVVVDMRNHYESRIGHFENAITPDVDTFQDELLWVKEHLKGKEDKKVLLYCTGGIRCEKASAYLKSNGFKDVNQLHGGIIQYAHEIKSKGLTSKFKGSNYVFDERISERLTDDILTECDQCDALCDQFTNCANVMCNLLFIQCGGCQDKMQNCCTKVCQDIFNLPGEERRKLRKRQKSSTPESYRRRVRPKLKNGSEMKPVYELK